ncbi:hypothetical protein QH494_02375 [Sphingomonas sp. AR_OL41]|uniref:hypothetical protein n=1 Tax=Sphingomonas sp. AR_OL41 TaxID=3042729 RepID=UPI002480DC67|nr:hypothetical protein [Sphingomonas sp. AR_OL41]MDH7971014.1 hypothetical protein [Sphingomonas sp. AR_OL41]
MGKLLSLLLASFMAPQALSAADDPALHLVQEFVAAVRHNPGQAKTYAEDGVNLDFGDYVGGRSIDRFAKEASNCQLRSISQPSVPKNWNLDGARYFQIIWRCPPPFGPRMGPDLRVALFVKQKIIAGGSRFGR